MDIQQLATQLAQGIKPTLVAKMHGIADSTLSELTKTPKFLEIFEPLKEQFTNTRLDKRYAELEEASLKELQSRVTSEFVEVHQLTRILETLARVKQSKIPTPLGGLTNNGLINLTQQVTLQLPDHAKSELVINEKGEIIAFGQRSLAPLQSSAVIDIFKQLDKQRIEDSNNIFPITEQCHEPANLPSPTLESSSSSATVAQAIEPTEQRQRQLSLTF